MVRTFNLYRDGTSSAKEHVFLPSSLLLPFSNAISRSFRTRWPLSFQATPSRHQETFVLWATRLWYPLLYLLKKRQTTWKLRYQYGVEGFLFSGSNLSKSRWHSLGYNPIDGFFIVFLHFIPLAWMYQRALTPRKCTLMTVSTTEN